MKFLCAVAWAALYWAGFTSPAAAQVPDAPLNSALRPVEHREVSIPTPDPNITIAGTLSLPAGEQTRPAVLMIVGNGPHTRDQLISNTPMFKLLGDHLAALGLVVLRTDARGYGGSTGPADWEQYTTADRIEDNRAAVEFLRRQPGVDAQRLVVLGHSEGALIAAALSAGSPDVALAILLSPPALRGDEVVAGQLAASLVQQGAEPDTAEAVRQAFLRFAEFAVAEPDNDAKFEAIALDFLAAHGVSNDQLDPTLAKSLLSGYLASPWYRHFFASDPTTTYRQNAGPVVAIFGGADQQVPWRIHLPKLTAAYAQSASNDLSACVLPDQDHFFLEFEGRRIEKHKPGEMQIADELLDRLDAELGRHGLATPADTTAD